MAPPRLRMRARIVLRAAEGRTDRVIAQELGVTPATVSLWRHRFVVHGLEGLRRSAPRAGRLPAKTRNLEARILRTSLKVPPPDGRRWSTRSLARYLSVSHMQVYRVWKAHGLPRDGDHRVTRPLLRGPWVDVVGFLRCSPLRAIVFAVDKTPVRSPSVPNSWNGERATGPGPLPLISAPGAPELAWSLDELQELLPDRAIPLSQPKDLPIFLRTLEHSGGSSTRFHVIVEHPDPRTLRQLRAWVVRRPRFEVETVGTDAEWNRSVGRFCRGWNAQRISGSSFRGVAELTEALLRFAGNHSDPELAFEWTGLQVTHEGISGGFATRRGLASGAAE